MITNMQVEGGQLEIDAHREREMPERRIFCHDVAVYYGPVGTPMEELAPIDGLGDATLTGEVGLLVNVELTFVMDWDGNNKGLKAIKTALLDGERLEFAAIILDSNDLCEGGLRGSFYVKELMKTGVPGLSEAHVTARLAVFHEWLDSKAGPRAAYFAPGSALGISTSPTSGSVTLRWGVRLTPFCEMRPVDGLRSATLTIENKPGGLIRAKIAFGMEDEDGPEAAGGLGAGLARGDDFSFAAVHEDGSGLEGMFVAMSFKQITSPCKSPAILAIIEMIEFRGWIVDGMPKSVNAPRETTSRANSAYRTPDFTLGGKGIKLR